EHLGPADVLAVGAAQAVALLPGISRSGITISTGLARGFARDEAARLSFLLATPVIAGAGAKTLLDARSLATLTADPTALGVGFAVAFVAGLAAIAFLMRFLRARTLLWFVPYRLALAAVALFL
ncbi:MAG: undecaprenyl-diphosphate phosphatase, partial [Chloroflexi bacterium]|nr:undecaprenyl-diphosphate phosphatase [Chloroflexota bacterium]